VIRVAVVVHTAAWAIFQTADIVDPACSSMRSFLVAAAHRCIDAIVDAAGGLSRPPRVRAR
jgi:hypothetical protein